MATHGRTRLTFLVVVLLGVGIDSSLAQDEKTTQTQGVPVATQWVLSGARNDAQKSAIKSVLLIVCRKDGKKGTGFALAQGGLIVTNSHVVGSCAAQELVAASSLGRQIVFSGFIRDTNRDLALLCPTTPVVDGLQLAADGNPQIETEIETWGYPLSYQNFAPILSRGYVAGYWERTYKQDDGRPGHAVKHLIINGAFNPGNSGGPLIDRSTGKVIGIVVEKWGLYSPMAETVINGLPKSGLQTNGGFQHRDEHGNVTSVSNEAAISMVLKEFYDASQVMIGEAISASELSAFLKEKQQSLGCKQS
jgi:S1-C subfamily serine protease